MTRECHVRICGGLGGKFPGATRRRAGLCLWPPADFVYKAHTNDTPRSRRLLRRSIPPAIRICRDLLEDGAVLQVVDPKVSEHQIAADLGTAPGSGEGSWHLVADTNQAASGADALLLLTE